MLNASTALLLLSTAMADGPFTVVGDSNILGSNLTNVGNRTYNYGVTVHAPDRQFLLLPKTRYSDHS